jgi:iron complex transport system ATP-binding protein
MIDFEKVSIGFDKTLFHIDFLKLNPSQLYVLVGRNGSGKSTLLSTITGEIKPIKGKITLANKEISAQTLKEKSKNIALVLPKMESIPYLTVREYISLGRYPYTNTLGKLTKTDDEIIEACIDMIGIESIAEKFTTSISDGERQLVAITRALAQDTPIILLDEPTAFLDYGNRIKILKVLQDLARNQEKCILLSSHDIDLCLDFNLPILLIDQQNQKLIECEPRTPKAKILEIGFEIF